MAFLVLCSKKEAKNSQFTFYSCDPCKALFSQPSHCSAFKPNVSPDELSPPFPKTLRE